MAGVDLSTYVFDYDLTFAVLLMNADGTIYHTYGGRDWTSAQSHLSMPALVDVMRKTLLEHDRYREDPKPPKRVRKTTIEEIPPMARRIRNGKAPKCFHCHMVRDMRTEDARENRRWSRDQIWVYPDPSQIGLSLDRDSQTLVTAVAEDSPAARAGLRKGDRLILLGGRSVLSFGDVSTVLHDTSPKSGNLAVEWTHGTESRKGRLRLKGGWKQATPLVFSWRPSKWPRSPKPGFGGNQLKPDELERLGLGRDTFAFRVTYIVTWGKDANTGRNAQRAGIRKGDVILSIGGEGDFRSVEHFHAWFRLTQKPGTEVAIVRLRGGRKETLRMKVVP